VVCGRGSDACIVLSRRRLRIEAGGVRRPCILGRLGIVLRSSDMATGKQELEMGRRSRESYVYTLEACMRDLARFEHGLAPGG
jgi:hypothetical protein